MNNLDKWTDGDEEEKEREKWRTKDHAKSVEAKLGVIPYIGPQPLSEGGWGGVFMHHTFLMAYGIVHFHPLLCKNI